MYKITFEDKTEFFGEKSRDWDKMSEKRIHSFEYVLGNKRIILRNYEMYNHLLKYALIGGTTQPLQIIIMGLKNNIVTKIVCDIKEHTIKKYRLKLGYEFNDTLSLGWKRGIDNKIESFEIYAKNN